MVSATQNLRDGLIIRDYIVTIDGVMKIGTVSNFTPPDIEIETEMFRGGGMDGPVEMPMGIKQIEFNFDLLTWDADIFSNLGYGVGSMDVPVNFYAYGMTGGGTTEQPVVINTFSLVKSVKPGQVDPGKQVKVSVSLAARYYKHVINNVVVSEIDMFNKVFKNGNFDTDSNARKIMGFGY